MPIVANGRFRRAKRDFAAGEVVPPEFLEGMPPGKLKFFIANGTLRDVSEKDAAAMLAHREASRIKHESDRLGEVISSHQKEIEDLKTQLANAVGVVEAVQAKLSAEREKLSSAEHDLANVAAPLPPPEMPEPEAAPEPEPEAEPEPEVAWPDFESEFDKLSKRKLLKAADSMGLTLSGGMSKADLISVMVPRARDLWLKQQGEADRQADADSE